jgi:hypothetical protein
MLYAVFPSALYFKQGCTDKKGIMDCNTLLWLFFLSDFTKAAGYISSS